ncbi:MAG: hypothetical protein HC838_02565 [Spirulinaceae cyanobacterium RM2_2_10]|nr:hypothetical protein [Spirulinaceae cyanobacterium RM2_2_10]
MNLPRRLLTGLGFASLLVVIAALPGRTQSSDRLTRTALCLEPLAAQREAQLLDAIEQARRERAGNTVSLSEALQSFEGLAPGADSDRFTDLLGRLETALSLFGGGEMLQGLDLGEVTAIMGPLRDRLAPLIQGNFNADDPLAMMQVMMDAMAEIRQVKTERARVAPNRVESLQRELNALRQQCPQARTTTPPATAPALPAPEPAVVARNGFTTTCDRQGGSAITYFEGSALGHQRRVSLRASL